MKILLIVDDLSVTGGAERVTANLANAFSDIWRGGDCVEILSIGHIDKTTPYTLNPHIKLHFIQPYSPKQLSKFSQQIKKFWRKAQVIFYKLKLLITTRHTYKTREILWLMADEPLNHKLNSYLDTLDCDVVLDSTWHSYYPLSKKPHTTYMKLLHTSYYGNGIRVDRKYFEKIKGFDRLIVLSDKDYPLWHNHHKNVRVIPNFLPQIPSLNTTYSQKAVLSVGRLSKEKGFLRLLDNWKIVQDRIKDSNMNCESTHSVIANEVKQSAMFQNGLPRFGTAESRNDDNLTQWQLIIVGDGVLKKEIESKIKELNLQDSIILKPFTKQIEKEYLSVSIYAMSSHFEGFPMVLIEASSYALPCIAFDIATGPSDIIENEKSGFLVADNDLQGYADKLMLLMCDENLRQNFGTKAKRVVSERFSKNAVMKEWEKLFGELKKMLI